nr:MAG: hypothetical protein [Lake Baikal virophage 14]
MYKVQSIIFNKSKFSLYLCKQWLKEHQYKDKDLDDKTNFYRFRQFNPTSLKKQGYSEFRTKKLGKSGIELIIAYKPEKTGGRISNDDLHHFIHASYNKGESYKGWKLDSSLSDSSVQVYFNGKDAVVVHRGSQDAQDWYENGRLILGLDAGKRLEHSRKIQKLAEQKYGANNVITIGHSKGAYHAEEVGQDSREIYTLNKPVTPYDLLKGKKVSEKQTDIRTTLDPVSILRPLQQGSDYQNIWSKTLNPITEHLGSVLKRVNPATWWGRGRCWDGYEPVPGKKPYSKGSCKKTGKKEVLKNYQGFLNHLTSHIGDPNEPIDPKDFKQSKEIINAIYKVKSGAGAGASTPAQWWNRLQKFELHLQNIDYFNPDFYRKIVKEFRGLYNTISNSERAEQEYELSRLDLLYIQPNPRISSFIKHVINRILQNIIDEELTDIEEGAGFSSKGRELGLSCC